MRLTLTVCTSDKKQHNLLSSTHSTSTSENNDQIYKTATMELSVILLVMVLFQCIHKSLNKVILVKWRVLEKIDKYGENLILQCNAEDYSKNDGIVKRWLTGPGQKLLTLNEAPVSGYASKYEMKEEQNGFNLIIKNTSKADLNVEYKCSHGYDTSGSIFLKIEDAFKVKENKEESKENNFGINVVITVVILVAVMSSVLFVLYQKGILKKLNCTCSEYEEGIHGPVTICAIESNQEESSDSETDGESTRVISLIDHASTTTTPRADDPEKSICGWDDNKSKSGQNFGNFFLRMESFRSHDWPIDLTSFIRQIAEAGFYCIGSGAMVKCFACGAELIWEAENDPYNKDFHKNCLHLQEKTDAST